MDLTALLLSRLQFAFTVSFHIIFPSFTIGLAAWLTVLEALHSVDRASGVPIGVRILAEDIRRGVWARCRLRDRDGIPVRYQLERAGPDVRTDPRPTPLIRNLHCLFSRGELFRDPAVWPASRAAVVLSVLDCDGGARHHAVGVLDHGQQQLDAGAGRLCDRERRF